MIHFRDWPSADTDTDTDIDIDINTDTDTDFDCDTEYILLVPFYKSNLFNTSNFC